MKLLVYDVYLKDRNNEEAMVSLCLESGTVRKYFDSIQFTYHFNELPNNEFKKNIDKVAKEMIEEELNQDPTNFIVDRLERNIIKESAMEEKRFEEDAV